MPCHPREGEDLRLYALTTFFVYILANERPTLYVGVTNNLWRRIVEHRLKVVDGFTKKYNLTKLVYYEVFFDIQKAIEREKQLKHWNRDWKLKLIKELNPTFIDLYDKLLLMDPRSGRG